ncbi:MAG: ATP-binding protein [Chloroflexota bacterium]
MTTKPDAKPIENQVALHGELAAARAETVRLEALVQDLDERLELALAASRIGLWEWQIATGTLVWSDQVSIQHGLPAGVVPGGFDAYLATIHPDDRESFLARVGGALEAHQPYSFEFRIVWPDGSIHWTHGAGRAFYDEAGQPVRMIGTGQDITERRRLEIERDALVVAERRANEWREVFIAVLSHELRTPITTILGASAVLMRPSNAGSDERRGELLEDISSEAARLDRIVSDLVVLSQAERGVLDSVCEPLGLRRVIDRVAEAEARRWPGITFELDPGRSHPVVLAEETYVEQVVRNILGNAAKYGRPDGHVRIVFDTAPGETIVRILDDGPGFPSGDTHRLFEPFYRSPTFARQVSGSGIGLFVCARLIEAMGGRIWAAARPEGGAEFGFALRTVDETTDV